jgi:hypothetical protein
MTAVAKADEEADAIGVEYVVVSTAGSQSEKVSGAMMAVYKTEEVYVVVSKTGSQSLNVSGAMTAWVEEGEGVSVAT